MTSRSDQQRAGGGRARRRVAGARRAPRRACGRSRWSATRHGPRRRRRARRRGPTRWARPARGRPRAPPVAAGAGAARPRVCGRRGDGVGAGAVGGGRGAAGAGVGDVGVRGAAVSAAPSPAVARRGAACRGARAAASRRWRSSGCFRCCSRRASRWFSLLSAGRAEEVAGNAAEAGAVALLQGREPRAAVRAALAGLAAGSGRQVQVGGRRVTVRRHAGRPVRRAPARERDGGRGAAAMSGLLERAAAAFGPPSRSTRRASRRARSCSAGPATRCRSRRRSPAGCASSDRAAGALLVGVAGPAPPRAALGTPAASRLAARLQARGLERGGARPAGVAGARPDELALAARAGAAVDVPAVIAVTGPRTTATDALLAEQDLVVLVVGADAEPGLEALALAGLADCAAPVVVQRPLDRPGARPRGDGGVGRCAWRCRGDERRARGSGASSRRRGRRSRAAAAPGRPGVDRGGRRARRARPRRARARARRARWWAGGAGAAGGGPRRAGRRAGDARRLRAAVRARLRRPRAARPAAPLEGGLPRARAGGGGARRGGERRARRARARSRTRTRSRRSACA